MDAFLIAFGLIFLAELGDKTQLLAIALAARYDGKRVLAGVFLGTFAINLVSVAAGELIGSLVPDHWISIAAGIAFLGFGAWILFDDDEDEEEEEKRTPRKVVLSVAAMIFVAEIGDKTMLAAMTIASHERQLVSVWLGASTGMFCAIAIGAGIGSILGRRLPERPIRIIAAVAFLATGGWLLISSFV